MSADCRTLKSLWIREAAARQTVFILWDNEWKWSCCHHSFQSLSYTERIVCDTVDGQVPWPWLWRWGRCSLGFPDSPVWAAAPRSRWAGGSVLPGGVSAGFCWGECWAGGRALPRWSEAPTPAATRRRSGSIVVRGKTEGNYFLICTTTVGAIIQDKVWFLLFLQTLEAVHTFIVQVFSLVRWS